MGQGQPFRARLLAALRAVLVALFGPYFSRVALAMVGRAHVHGGTQYAVIAAFVVIEIVLRAVIAFQSPRDARAPRDEREDLIDMRATRVAFHVLLAGALIAIFSLHFRELRQHQASVWMLSQFVLFAVVTSELVRFGSQIRMFRRGF